MAVTNKYTGLGRTVFSCCTLNCVAIIVIIVSIVKIENAKQYEDGTLTLCTVTNRNYDGECTSGKATGEMYTYTAVSPLCPDVELHSKIEACQWKPENKNWYDYDEIMKVDVDETEECYVPDCSENSFAWDWDIQWQRGRAWNVIYWCS